MTRKLKIIDIADKYNPVIVYQETDLPRALSPLPAKMAARNAVGRDYDVIVWDEEYGVGFRFYRESMRRLKKEG